MKAQKSFVLAAVAALLSGAAVAEEENAKEAAQPVKAEEAKDSMIEAPDNVAAAPADAEVTDSGLKSIILEKGDGGEKPLAADTVKVHYTGWTTDGKMFDSSVQRGEPTSFPLNGVIKGWTEGVQLMEPGEKRRFWIPADLAYGENPGGGRPGGELVFDIELLEVKSAPKPPADLDSPPADAEKSESGLVSKVLSPGTGTEKPSKEDTVQMNFSAWDKDGNLMQSTAERGPITAPLGSLSMPGWAEGVQLMVAGEKRRMWIPQSLTFGDSPPQGAPTGQMVFDVELLDVKKAAPAPEVPADVAAAPADAEKTESGLASKVLKEGSGESPKATDTVSVHYTGWETNGEMFDSSVVRGEPTSFPLNQVISGWTEGVQLMKVGEKRRFWIPQDLAYGPKQEGSGRPGGMLVFDVELLEIK